MTFADAALTGQILDAVSWVLILLGGFFVVVGAIGMIRMPDFYTRIHAVSVAETLGVSLLIIGLILQTDNLLVIFKLVTLLGIIFFTGPVVAHALAQAALHASVDPILHADHRGRLESSGSGDAAAGNDSKGRPASNS